MLPIAWTIKAGACTRATRCAWVGACLTVLGCVLTLRPVSAGGGRRGQEGEPTLHQQIRAHPQRHGDRGACCVGGLLHTARDTRVVVLLRCGRFRASF